MGFEKILPEGKQAKPVDEFYGFVMRLRSVYFSRRMRKELVKRYGEGFRYDVYVDANTRQLGFQPAGDGAFAYMNRGINASPLKGLFRAFRQLGLESQARYPVVDRSLGASPNEVTEIPQFVCDTALGVGIGVRKTKVAKLEGAKPTKPEGAKPTSGMLLSLTSDQVKALFTNFTPTDIMIAVQMVLDGDGTKTASDHVMAFAKRFKVPVNQANGLLKYILPHCRKAKSYSQRDRAVYLNSLRMGLEHYKVIDQVLQRASGGQTGTVS